MSLDNVLAVGAIAADAAPNDPNRYVPLLVAGLLFSMVLLFVASAVISRLIEWIPILIDLAAVVLGWTAANLIAADTVVGRQFQLTGDRSLYLHLGCVAVVLVADLVLRLVRRGRGKKAAAADTAPGVPEQLPEQSSTAGRE
jgi:predicted tellurium resistance membrane protein TerC